MENVIKLMASGRARLENRETQVLNAPTREPFGIDESFYSLRQELQDLVAPPPPCPPPSRAERIRQQAVRSLKQLLEVSLSGDSAERRLSLGQISAIGQLVRPDDPLGL